MHPVFYLMDGSKLIFFGHTQMFRLPYRNSPQEMLHPVHSSDQYIDLAEAIFGRVKGDQGGEAGRVFVGDAALAPDETTPWLPDEPEVIPEILSGPKPTTFQHYLTQDQPNTEKGKGLHTYNDDTSQTTLRGYKLYWHKGEVERDDFTDDLSERERRNDTQHTRIKPVRQGVRFHGCIRFENLLPAEFGILWWALTLPTEGEHYHKIGMGKPLGLGAIEITPHVEFVHAQDRYRSLIQERDEGWKWVSGREKAQMRDQIVETSVTTFEKLISRKVGNTSFAEIPRIQELLAMLSWPGPDPKQTRYMEIERQDPSAKRGKRNEYKKRPVLPTPKFLLEQAPSTTRQHTSSRDKSSHLSVSSDNKRGAVKRWLGNRNFGFIEPDEKGEDVFVHGNNLPHGISSLRPGQRVRYRTEQAAKGPRVTWIELID
jgi:cold shock CspA family protein